ncbi:MAG: hypothetical protein H6590_04565 [Flavobacteriales bacterium]|nr:hypothetical protein [Flavobacteriales bacterium]
MRFARTLGMRDEEQTLIRWSSSAKPSLGGITFYILFLACFSLYGLLFPGQSAAVFCAPTCSACWAPLPWASSWAWLTMPTTPVRC